MKREIGKREFPANGEFQDGMIDGIIVPYAQLICGNAA